MQARWGTHGDHPIIVLCPRGVRETYDLTLRAFNLAELYRTPVILLLDEIISHVSERVVLPESVRVVDVASVSAGKKNAGTATIRFSTKGYVDKTLIHLRDDDGRDMTLILSPFLAVTRVVDSYVDIDDDKARY